MGRGFCGLLESHFICDCAYPALAVIRTLSKFASRMASEKTPLAWLVETVWTHFHKDSWSFFS